MTLVLDAGALLAYERGDRTVRAFLERANRAGVDVRTTTGAVAQVWRNGARQVRLTRLLPTVHELELTRQAARRVGVLLAQAKAGDIVDASIVDAAVDGDEILTSDPGDLHTLARASGRTLIITLI